MHLIQFRCCCFLCFFYFNLIPRLSPFNMSELISTRFVRTLHASLCAPIVLHPAVRQPNGALSSVPFYAALIATSVAVVIAQCVPHISLCL